MRIIFFVHRYAPDVGGVQISVERTAAALTTLGHEVHVITETPGPAVHPDGVMVHRLSIVPRRPVTRMLMWREMRRLHPLFSSADVLHFHDYGTFIHWFAPMSRHYQHAVYAMTFHGFDAWPIPPVHRILRDVAAQYMDVTFAVGEYIRRHYGHRIDYSFIGAPTIPSLLQAAKPDSSALPAASPHTSVSTHTPGSGDLAASRGSAATGDGRASDQTRVSDMTQVPAVIQTLGMMEGAGSASLRYSSSVLYVGRLDPDTGAVQTLDALEAAASMGHRRCAVTIVGADESAHARLRATWPHLELELHPATRDLLPHYTRASIIIATGFLAVLDAFAAMRPVLIPALSPIKRSYFASIPQLDEMALVARTQAQLTDCARMIVEGHPSAPARIERAARFAARHTWETIARLHLQAYTDALNNAYPGSSMRVPHVPFSSIGTTAPHGSQSGSGETAPNNMHRNSGVAGPKNTHRDGGAVDLMSAHPGVRETAPDSTHRDNGAVDPNIAHHDNGVAAPNNAHRDRGVTAPNNEHRDCGVAAPNTWRRHAGAVLPIGVYRDVDACAVIAAGPAAVRTASGAWQ